MPPKTEKAIAEEDRESRLASARDHADLAVQRAEVIFRGLRSDMPTASERRDLANASARLNAYPAELER